MFDKRILTAKANAIQAVLIEAEDAVKDIDNDALRADAIETLADLHAYANTAFQAFKDRHPILTQGVALRSGGTDK